MSTVYPKINYFGKLLSLPKELIVTTLIIYSNTLTAVEVYCGDDVKYVESFATWNDLLTTLAPYFDSYVWIEVR